MFIECQHCHTIYKIDEKKIPSQESFVRCSNCFKPITLKVEEKLVSSRMLNKNVVECPECKNRYLVFSDKIREKSAKVRCGGCEHIFNLANSIIGKDLDDDKSLSLLENLSDKNESVSVNNEIHMQTVSVPKLIFEEDDDKENDENFIDDNNKIKDEEERPVNTDLESNISKTALEDYLEAVSMESRGGEDESKADIDTIPLDHKNKIFLRPYSKQDESTSETDNKDNDSGINKAELDDSLPLEDTLEVVSDFDTDEELELSESDELLREESLDTRVETKNRRKFIFVFLMALILVGLGAVGWLFFQNRSLKVSFPSHDNIAVPNLKNKSGLVILEPLKGRYATNKHEGEIFVIEGKVVNYYPKDVKVSYLQIEGSLYNKYNKEIDESKIYAGNVATEAELKKWTKKEIELFLTNKLGQNNVNLAIDSKKSISFQVIFFNASKDIYKIGAKISNFLKR